MTILSDFRYAGRLLRRSPGFTAVAVLTLGLGIGANTAVFSIVDAVFFRPLPYPDPGRLTELVRLWRAKGASGDDDGMTGRDWELVRDHATMLEAAAGGGSAGMNLMAGGHPYGVLEERVSAPFFHVLGIEPFLGRSFDAGEDRSGGPSAVVLSYDIWRRLFHADPRVLGTSVTLGGAPCTVVGVMPEGFHTSQRADLWGPLRPSTTGEGEGSNYWIVARLRPGVTRAQADGQLASLSIEAFRAMKLRPGESVRYGIVPLQQGLAREVRTPVRILWAAVGALLLIACINVAGLLFARGISRSRESATRLALGCARVDVLRPLIAESALLAVIGGGVGVALGYFAIQGLSEYARTAIGLSQDIRLDWRVVAAAAVIAVMTCILSGIAPAIASSHVDIRSALSEGGTRGVAGGRATGARRFLVIAEVALGLMLMIGAGLLLRTYLYITGQDPGFSARNVVTANASVQEKRYSAEGAVNRLFEDSLARIRAIPGVQAAAVSLRLPYERALNDNLSVPEIPAVQPDHGWFNLSYVTPGYFDTLGIRLLRGRGVAAGDTAQTRRVIVVNEALAEHYLKGHDPIGMHVRFEGETWEIVGVSANVLQAAGWGDFGPAAAVPCAYIPAAQTSAGFFTAVHTWFEPSWIVRTAGAAPGIGAEIQRAIEATDPRLPLSVVRTMQDVKHEQFAEQQFRAAVLSAMAGLGLLLAATGIYGLIARSVAERTREVGIRMAFGATTADAIRAVAGTGVKLTAIGVAAGALLALLATRVLRHVIFGVRETDPATFLLACATLLGVAVVASVVPALRLARINPADALRHE
ncbi:MAG TPA: ABC transporter permease [Bryobacteraceae bacterium]|nr:ABC transporter permease [Bryobacteraceae bacterium]